MEALGINLGFFIAQVINFLIIFGLLTVFGWGPLGRFLDNRSEQIAKGLEDQRVAAEARAKAEEEAQKIIAEANAAAQKIHSEARAAADERAKPIIRAAEEEADKIKAEARVAADGARDAALGSVRGQVTSLAIAAAHKLIGESVDKKKQEQMVDDFFTTAAADVKGLGDGLVVTTALPLTDAEQKKVEKSLGGSVSSWEVNPEILGGIVVRAGDKVVDGSVRSRLTGLSASLN
jgi:F-type H+-transporting ATPase subunit b